MAKFYFRQDDDERCYLKKSIIEDMKENGIKELKIFEAKRDLNTDYFWCTYYLEVGEVSEDCGRLCPAYEPRNGKNGRCRYSGSCYEPTEKFIILKLK